MKRDEFNALDPAAKMQAIKNGERVEDPKRATAKDAVYTAISDALSDNWPLSGGDGNEFDNAVAAIGSAITPFLKTEALDA